MTKYDNSGVPLEIVYIGNETPGGILFPVGQVDWDNNDYYNVAYLFKQCRDGIGASGISPFPLIGIHLNAGAQIGAQKGFYDGLLNAGPFSASDYDIQGVSYYPVWGEEDTIANFESTIAQMYSSYGKDIMLAETNWPQTCTDTSEYPLPEDTRDIPISAEGQAVWIQRLGDILNAQTGGLGFTYWEGAWLSNAGLGTECEDMLLVSDDGTDFGGFGAIGSL
ncbi:hypothetical protein KC333_g5702 [Hortaea werneckii]|nr:hypothetical protein KC333_g5702 [Hortaea werneckii]KAI7313635.1 hypothetical protein KC326_g5440 [Hortaea werneckii]